MNPIRSLMFGAGLAIGVTVLAQDPDPSPTASPKTAEPVADGTSTFDHLDVDRDGWLSESELKVHPQPLPAFTDLDQDADGRISTTEWNEREKFAVVVGDEH
jgi:hypothetical protein